MKKLTTIAIVLLCVSAFPAAAQDNTQNSANPQAGMPQSGGMSMMQGQPGHMPMMYGQQGGMPMMRGPYGPMPMMQRHSGNQQMMPGQPGRMADGNSAQMNPGMMSGGPRMMGDRMARIEKHLANIESLLRQLLAAQNGN